MVVPRRTRSVGEAPVGGGRDLSFTIVFSVFSHNSLICVKCAEVHPCTPSMSFSGRQCEGASRDEEACSLKADLGLLIFSRDGNALVN